MFLFFNDFPCFLRRKSESLWRKNHLRNNNDINMAVVSMPFSVSLAFIIKRCQIYVCAKNIFYPLICLLSKINVSKMKLKTFKMFFLNLKTRYCSKYCSVECISVSLERKRDAISLTIGFSNSLDLFKIRFPNWEKRSQQ